MFSWAVVFENWSRRSCQLVICYRYYEKCQLLPSTITCLSNLVMISHSKEFSGETTTFLCHKSLWGWSSTPLQIYHGGEFYWWRKPEHPEKNTDQQEFTDKVYNIMLNRIHLAIGVIRAHNISGDMHLLHR